MRALEERKDILYTFAKKLRHGLENGQVFREDDSEYTQKESTVVLLLHPGWATVIGLISEWLMITSPMNGDGSVTASGVWRVLNEAEGFLKIADS